LSSMKLLITSVCSLDVLLFFLFRPPLS